MVIVRNPTEAPIHVSHGERIAQMVLARYEVLEVVTGSVSVTTTRIGGFGSTGG
jgi:dUTPase